MTTFAHCDDCKAAISTEPTEVYCEADGIEICGRPVYVTAFRCPYCGRIYVVSVMTKGQKEILNNPEATIGQLKRTKERVARLTREYAERLESNA